MLTTCKEKRFLTSGAHTCISLGLIAAERKFGVSAAPECRGHVNSTDGVDEVMLASRMHGSIVSPPAERRCRF